MSKKVYIIILALTILLYTLIVLQPYIMEIGEVFGYIFWVVIFAGVIAAIWLLLKRPKKENE
jgi:4-hydroxybenzoate polyprenyltransferase